MKMEERAAGAGMRLDGRVAVITGGGRGIGRAIALAFAREGARVAPAARTAGQVEAVAAEIRALGREALPLVCDVTRADSVREAMGAAAGQWGRLDVLVNNAGVVERTKFIDCDEQTWNRTISTNLTGAYLCTQAVLPHMLAASWGRIINIGSIGSRHAVPYAPAYTAAKHGLIGLTRAVALEMAARGITVNAICPGWVESDMAEAAIQQIVEKTGRSPEQARKALEQMSPQQRMVTPEEVAALALMLASDEARSITGQAVNICGGSFMS